MKSLFAGKDCKAVYLENRGKQFAVWREQFVKLRSIQFSKLAVRSWVRRQSSIRSGLFPGWVEPLVLCSYIQIGIRTKNDDGDFKYSTAWATAKLFQACDPVPQWSQILVLQSQYPNVFFSSSTHDAGANRRD